VNLENGGNHACVDEKENTVKSKPASNQKWGNWLGAAAMGAIAMYFSDPNRGRRRRVRVRDKMRRLQGKTGKAIDVAVRDLNNRLEGMQAQVSHFLFRRSDTSDDQVVMARVRARFGRVISHPHAIEVAAQQGRFTLRGPILANEKEKLLAAVRAVPGVIEVEDQLEVHERSDGISSLQGGSERKQERPEFMQENWTPALRAVALLGGGALGYYGILGRRTPAGVVLALAGLALATRAVTNTPIKRLSGRVKKGPAIELHKVIEIQAPPEAVFDVWANYANFPHFMSHVLEVRDLGQQRSHWVVKGLAGAQIEWDAILTESTRPTTLAWKSEPGAAVDHAGSIRFEPSRNGTRVIVRMSYHPPAGAVGHGIAVLFSSDPKRELDDDLMRMKNFIESGIPSHDAAKPGSVPTQLLH
jgi:uncharacterized membrane protein